MSDTLDRVRRLVEAGEVVISEHGYDELAADRLTARDVVRGVPDARVVEDYPTYHKGPAVLVIQMDGVGAPIHVVWGISAGTTSPAVLVTAYRPDPERWSEDFTKRRG